MCNIKHLVGGGSGIRTHETVARLHAFQACAFNHSAIPPRAVRAQYIQICVGRNPPSASLDAYAAPGLVRLSPVKRALRARRSSFSLGIEGGADSAWRKARSSTRAGSV